MAAKDKREAPCTFILDRRSFISGLLAISALPPALRSLAPDALAEADAWAQIVEKPNVFRVHDWQQLELSDFGLSKPLREDVYNLFLDSVADVLETAERVQPLRWRLASLYDDWRERALAAEESKDEADPTFVGVDAIEAEWPEEIEDDVEILRRWLDCCSESERESVLAEAKVWAAEEPEYGFEEDCFENPANGYSFAFEFFQRLDFEALDILGVEIIEGEHPGSTYYAAELSIPIEEANRRAEEAGIPVRFVPA